MQNTVLTMYLLNIGFVGTTEMEDMAMGILDWIWNCGLMTRVGLSRT